VNLVLFSPAELSRPLPRSDPRAVHLLKVLKRQVGEAFDAGLINGPLGRATLLAIGAEALTFSFVWGGPPPPPEPVTLIIGLPRPQTARDMLRDATTLGVAAIHFVQTEKGERNYAQSSLWTTGEWQRHLAAGAAQAFTTRVPEISHGRTLAETMDTLPSATTHRLALDHYEATIPLGRVPITPEAPVVLALGPERGWSAGDRDLLRAHGFQLVHLGPRVLRCETAVVAALTLVRAARDRA
jgi:RsmE family RNA methyltransferase